ncbi:MAG: HNH endonuclease signature motif containing protein [Aeromicrobium erythreum]
MATREASGRPQPSNWRTTERRILERDEYRCYLGSHDATTVDHIVPVARGGSHDDDNLAAICQPCAEDRAFLAHRVPGGALTAVDLALVDLWSRACARVLTVAEVLDEHRRLLGGRVDAETPSPHLRPCGSPSGADSARSSAADFLGDR